MIRQIVTTLAFVSAAIVSTTPVLSQSATKDQGCRVTIGRKAPTLASQLFGAGSAHWSGNLYVGGLWPDGTIVFQDGGPGSIEADGSMGMKFGWFRGEGVRGKLNIHGKRLDGPAPPLRAHIPEGYGETGFQATGVIFPTEGCWEVTGEAGVASLTFVTRVVRVKAHSTQLKLKGRKQP